MFVIMYYTGVTDKKLLHQMLQVVDPTKAFMWKLFDEYKMNITLMKDLKEHEKPQSYQSAITKGKKG